jgi:hypothetical protein
LDRRSIFKNTEKLFKQALGFTGVGLVIYSPFNGFKPGQRHQKIQKQGGGTIF